MINKKYAFFDLDETVINIKSMFHFLNFFIDNVKKNNSLYASSINKKAINFKNSVAQKKPREKLNLLYYQIYQDVEYDFFKDMAKAWMDEIKADITSIVQPLVLECIKKEHSKNKKIVVVSGSFYEIMDVFVRHVGIDVVLATRLEVIDGKLSGRIVGQQTIGYGKAVVMQKFLQENNSVASICSAYGDDVSDIPMLECVGQAVAVIGNPDLADYAAKKNWNIINLKKSKKI